MLEKVLSFESDGESLIGILSQPAQASSVAVLILVGGPQYRIGSHRQFVSLARALARSGVAAFRFDFQGMGDSSGVLHDFEHHGTDIQSAIDVVMAAVPALTGVVLWGLCDAASAALLYVNERRDPRVQGLVLVNPWVRSEQSLADAQLGFYYKRRILQPDFWKKLFAGKISWRALIEWGGTLLATQASASAGQHGSFQQRMAHGWRDFLGAILLISAGADLTAHEFDGALETQTDWQGSVNRARLTRVRISNADHTFSRREHQNQLESETISWVQELAQ